MDEKPGFCALIWHLIWMRSWLAVSGWCCCFCVLDSESDYWEEINHQGVRGLSSDFLIFTNLFFSCLSFHFFFPLLFTPPPPQGAAHISRQSPWQSYIVEWWSKTPQYLIQPDCQISATEQGFQLQVSDAGSLLTAPVTQSNESC